MKQYTNSIKRFKPLEHDQEMHLVKRAQKGDQKARDAVISSNLRFVFQIAKSYQGRGMDFDDLVAEGNIGLIKALDKFDTSLGYKFISYAVWWVRQSIISSLYKKSATIRLPVNKINNIAHVNQAREELSQKLSREPSLDEIREYIDDDRVIEDLKDTYSLVRLDMERTDEGDATLHSVIAGNDRNEAFKAKQFKEDFDVCMKHFTDRERKILQMYYGIGSIRPYTLQEIGEHFDLTRERIRQIKEAVLIKLKQRSNTNYLLDYL